MKDRPVLTAHAHLPDVTDALLQRAARVRLACFDVDGTLTDGGLFLDAEGREGKTFHVQDGLGLVLLRRHGIEVMLVTARSGQVVEHRARELGIGVHQGVKDKLGLVERLCAERGLALEQVLFMGDDLADLTTLRRVGLAVAPANAHPWVAPLAHWTTPAGGGHGAARQACDLVLAAQGHVERLLQEGAA
ncbi:HAD-IIIA family hydrolase [Pseudoxanthomonas winnipegensis]|jgi:3-deoxy-D-manno-octulosonate 8-phosphate phosphatase (KDO 8-P phosphatase)|uniref:3-deoxy-D-manno-octulosonate 8-phosphate phosphatase KdsC n=1 Tax=Pseudoxanthomonas winnipegensis TaxID=2480810 RepID=A0A4Q8LYG6_9GAMM|nr:HAD-IIIA family hydrolase [Pseudoxanthomonas winnipegensis]RZZ86669.1 HAD-IIIA family hydrolase [Pseudoxanthomonas winnipegensis]TAA08131.1 HAD-IIIA family hydrolase [Pseudoxanthomonas winnipegensis]TAA21123.1 HAD-IIIA family hydrolase [Pseudoxanthomonas winnipegensis]TAA25210.1 HAD-IIIA family hydrolase [Pseudoxanthomonas winnipegensis]